MGIYRLLRGRHRRFEDGKLCEYTVGDLIDLDEKESRRLGMRIKPVGRTAAIVQELQNAPEQRTVFTPGDTTSLTVSKLKAVIANTQEPSQLDDIEERERANEKPRVTVFRAIEQHRDYLKQLDEE